MNRRIASWGSVSALAGVALLVTVVLGIRYRQHAARPVADKVGAHCDNPGDQKGSKKLPAGTILLAPSESAEIRGEAVCGHCKWGIGESCNLMLWDRDGQHVVQILPNQQLSEIQKIVGTCAGGDTAVVAKGALTQFDGMNYLLMSSFETTVKPKATAQAKSPVEQLADDGMTARYETKNDAAAQVAWTAALAQIEQPGVDPMAKYKVYGGLGGLHADRKEYVQARDLFAKAVTASKSITPNKKPLAFSYYNQACAEGLLGDREKALEHLTLAIETQHLVEADGKTNCNKYDVMAGTDEAFVALHGDARFQKLLAPASN